MKKILLFFLVLLLIFLSSCNGYNKIMRNHLSDPENYGTYQAIIVECTTESLTVTFEDRESIRKFLGADSDPEIPMEEYRFTLVLTKENSQLLTKSGFYETVSAGDKITIRASNYIYMDSNFFQIAMIEHGETVYLPFEKGLQNIITMMENNKSLL